VALRPRKSSESDPQIELVGVPKVFGDVIAVEGDGELCAVQEYALFPRGTPITLAWPEKAVHHLSIQESP
jgi:hypothetical protein